MTTWAIIPVKPLRYGKSRLAHILSPDERAQLTTTMLHHTLQVLENVSAIYRTLVISRDPAALKLARQYGAHTYGEGDKQDLNLALGRAAHIAAARDASGILILPADLPLLSAEDVKMMLAGATPLMPPAQPPNNGHLGYHHNPRVVTICPDKHKEGTNALFISPPTGFDFKFGKDSFARHLREAERLGIPSRVVHAPGIKFDLDTEEDWINYLAISGNMELAAEG